MRIALKNGLLVALAVAVCVIVKHFGVHGRVPPWVDGVLFTLFELGGIWRGVREKRGGGDLHFGVGLKTGLAIAFVYAVASTVFFGILYAIVGPSLLEGAGESGHVAGAFAGLFVGAMVTGLVLALLVSAALRRTV